MKVRVRLFAQARETVGAERFDCEVAGATVDVQSLLCRVRENQGVVLYGLLTAPGVRVAVNQEFVDLDHRLTDGDEVAFLPRVTGG